MMGFSQGGQVVAGVHRELDRRPLQDYHLKGSVAVAGPFELRKTSLPKAVENECLKCVGYLAWGASAYASYYGHDLREALKPAYVDAVPKLFDGSKTMWEIGAALPAKPEDMFQPQFLKAMRTNGDNWFTKGMDRNETYRWVAGCADPTLSWRCGYGRHAHGIQSILQLCKATWRQYQPARTRQGRSYGKYYAGLYSRIQLV